MKVKQGNGGFQPIIITLETKQEAQTLADLFGRVGGSRSGRRGVSQDILDALGEFGITYTPNDEQLDGHLYFKD